MPRLMLRLSRLILPATLSGLAACASLGLEDAPRIAPAVVTESGPEAEARAALVNVMSVAMRKDVAAFKKLILPADRADFDAREREHPGLYEAMMTDISAAKAKDYRLELDGSIARFTTRFQAKLGDYRTKTATTVVLVRDGSEWKVGKS